MNKNGLPPPVCAVAFPTYLAQLLLASPRETASLQAVSSPHTTHSREQTAFSAAGKNRLESATCRVLNKSGWILGVRNDWRL